ncbi:MAG: hypothetical protein KIT63_19235 [Rhodoferax sp.]|nr:hypothetical protein [Rhodoferax sp.]
MADTRPTPLGFLGALRLCVLLLFFPQKFIAAQQADVANREGYKEGQEEEHGAYTVRRAFGYSLLLVVLFGGGGFLVGMGLGVCAAERPRTIDVSLRGLASGRRFELQT